MDVNEALEFVDKLMYDGSGKYLSDLERDVFKGSWEGLTYKEIDPQHYEYLEKDVGYKLWKKLTSFLNEQVGKKSFRGAVERAYKTKHPQPVKVPLDQGNGSMADQTKSVFITYCHQELGLANELYHIITEFGWQAFMVNLNFKPNTGLAPAGSKLGADWFFDIDTKLKESNYFLLLLSPQTAVSEMAIEMLRRVKELRDSQPNHKPIVLTIRVNCPANIPLSHDLRCYLEGIGQREWNSPTDTPILRQEILNLLAGKKVWDVKAEENYSVVTNHYEGHSETITPTLPPLPGAEPELPNGQVRLASVFYVERFPYEAKCNEVISQPGALIRIKAPRQMGKTSLMARVLYHAKEKLGYRTVPLSFQHADAAVFTDLNQFLRWFCAKISRKLRLPNQLDDYWTDTFGSKDNCTIYFEDCLLANSDSPLVLALDEVDRIFQYPKIADDFFGLLRAWYEEAGYGNTDGNLWEKLRLVVVHSTEVYLPLNVNQSPFNVGLPIELPEFSLEQVQYLLQQHGLVWQSKQIKQLMALVGGHPYLVRLALYHIAKGQNTLDELIENAPTEGGLYDDHLRRHLWNLRQYPELAEAFSKVVTANVPIELESAPAFKLHSMGLVKFQGNQVVPRFDLYRIYFGERL